MISVRTRRSFLLLSGWQCDQCRRGDRSVSPNIDTHQHSNNRLSFLNGSLIQHLISYLFRWPPFFFYNDLFPNKWYCFCLFRVRIHNSRRTNSLINKSSLLFLWFIMATLWITKYWSITRIIYSRCCVSDLVCGNRCYFITTNSMLDSYCILIQSIFFISELSI